MVSSYLQRPIRIFEQALEDRAWVRRESPKLGPGIPADPAVDRHKPIGVLNRLVAINHGTAADDSHFGGRLPDSPADRSAGTDSGQGTLERTAEIPPRKRRASSHRTKQRRGNDSSSLPLSM